MAAARYYTANMVRRLNQAERRPWRRYETVHGELLVSPGPRLWHQGVVGRLMLELGIYLRREPAGMLFTSPSEISWGLSDLYVQPDVFMVPVEQARTLEWRALRPLLVAEVLSPSTARVDRTIKRRLYQEQGVPLYWIVDADARHVEVWTPDDVAPRIERETITWRPAGALTPFALSLGELFRPF